MAPNIVRNYVDHTIKHKVHYRHSHKFHPSPTKDIDYDNENIATKSENFGEMEQGIRFNEKGQIHTPLNENSIEVIEKTPKILKETACICSFCDFN